MELGNINFTNSNLLNNVSQSVDNNPTNYVDNGSGLTIDPSVLALIKKRDELMSMPLGAETSSADYFAGQNIPVTQQGVSGSYVNAPTIAPTGMLVPFSAIDAKNREAYIRKSSVAPDKFVMPDLTKLSDLANNPQYQNASYSILQNRINEIQQGMKEQGISLDNFGTVANNDQSLKRIVSDINDVTSAWNTTYTMAQNILTDSQDPESKVYSKETVDKARQIYSGMDAYINAPTVENLNRVKENMLVLQGAANLDKVTTNITQSIKNDIQQNVEFYKSTTDYDAYLEAKVSSPFLKPIVDKNKKIIGWESDQEQIDTFIKNSYDRYYGNQGGLVDFKDFKNNMEAKIGTEITDVLKTVGTPSRGRIAEYDAKKKIDQVDIKDYYVTLKVADASGKQYSFNASMINIPTNAQSSTTGNFLVAQVATTDGGVVLKPTTRNVYGTLTSYGYQQNGQRFGIVSVPLDDGGYEDVYVIGNQLDNTFNAAAKKFNWKVTYGGASDELNGVDVPNEGDGQNINKELEEKESPQGWRQVK